MRFIVLASLLLTFYCSGCNDSSPESTQHPNVIIIVADDQGWGDLSIHGNPDISTPNIDRLAKEGASFDRFYVQPVCSPTRAELLTGRYHVRAGVRGTSAGGERIDLDERLISEAFKDSGYRTACFGKWHSGSQHPYHPNSRGFDEYYGFTSGHWGNYFDPPLDHNGKMVHGQGFLPDDLTNHAIDYINSGDDPFFIFMAYNTPHSPMQVPDRWWNKYANTHIEAAPEATNIQNHARAALAMVENLDWNVGRIMQRLNDLNLEENTIIIYMTDNGPNGQRWNGGMKGIKGSTDEGGVRSPLFVRWKNKIQAGLFIKEISAAIDLAPTLLELCQIDGEEIEYDGESLSPLLLQPEREWPDRMLIHHWRGKTSVRSSIFKLDHEENLYDMVNDPGQTKVISEPDSHLLSVLVNYKNEWKNEVLSELSEKDERPFPIGHMSSTSDYLPAGDAIAHGNIQRSNRYPNDSYFTNWISINDSITWSIEILSEGDYQFSIHYTCPENQVGSTMELKIGDQALKYIIVEPHDPPLIGADQDRTPRIESYVKEFREIEIGELHLDKGQNNLVLKAVEVAHDIVLDINKVTVKRRQ